MTRAVGGAVLELVEGNIVDEATDAIVNAANSGLRGGGGVDGAIHLAGGPAIMAECRRIGRCETGDAVITTAGALKARHVIHTVGPIYSGSARDAELLASCYRRCIEVADASGLASVAFPSISTGAYGYPLDEAAEVALRATVDAMWAHPSVRKVRFVLYGTSAYQAYASALERLLPE